MQAMKVHNPNNLPTKPIADLLATQGDLKDLSETNYKKLKNTIERRGFSYPVYVWEDSKGLLHLLDGHQRQRVLTTEGWNEPIPYLKVPANDLQEAMARLLEITSQYATITQEGIDTFIAKYELNEAEVYEATSFDALGSYGSEEPEVEEDEAPEVDESEPPKSKLGEIYQLGRHRVMCADSTVKENVELLMDGNKADMVFTDPPFPNNSGIMHDMIDGIDRAFDNARTHCNGLMIFFWDNLFEPDFSESITSKLIWHKTNGWQAGHYETMYCFHGDNKRHEQIVYSEISVGSNNIRSEVGNHQTPKPPSLLPLVIGKKYSSILDPFLGSGSTLIACEQTDRTCFGMELDCKYLDVVRKRWAKYVYPDRWEEEWEQLTPAIET